MKEIIWQGVVHGNPITKKNHMRIVANRATGKPMVIQSEQYKAYEASALWQLRRNQRPINFPVNVQVSYYMETKRKTDLTNLLEATDDILVTGGILEDDNYTILQSHDGSRVYVDKKSPRCEIIIEKEIKDNAEERTAKERK